MPSSYQQISATTQINPQIKRLTGVFCSSSTAGTLTIYDSATSGTGTKIVDTFILTGGTYYPLPTRADTGLYLVIGGTAALTVMADPL